MGAEQRTGPLAQHALNPGRATPRDPWSDRTAASHWHEGREWAVVVDWAEAEDGTRLPASVTLSSLGGNLHEATAPGAQPAAVTRALIDSIPWASVISASRSDLSAFAPETMPLRQYQPTSTQQAQHAQRSGSTRTQRHDDMLRLVARIYLSLGGEGTPRIAQAVTAELQRLGATPMRRGKEPTDGEGLDPTTVRRWVKEARMRGYLPPSTRRPPAPEAGTVK